MTERLNTDTERARSPKTEPLRLDRHDAAYVAEVKLAHLLHGVREDAKQQGRPHDSVVQDEQTISAARDILGQVGWNEIEDSPPLSVAIGRYREEMGSYLSHGTPETNTAAQGFTLAESLAKDAEYEYGRVLEGEMRANPESAPADDALRARETMIAAYDFPQQPAQAA